MADDNTFLNSKLTADFMAKVDAAVEAEHKSASPFHRLIDVSVAHRKFRTENELHDIFRLGYNEFSRYLDTVQRDFEADCRLSKLTCLADRVHGNYRAAMICYMNGLDQTAFDIMRDVMEITYLIRDFVLNPDHIEEWADGSKKNRRNKFGAGKLRKRFADHLGVETGDLLDTQEYNTHSEMLHVNPTQDLLLQRGVCVDRPPVMSARFALADIFHHAKDVSFIFHRVMQNLSVKQSTDPSEMEFLPCAIGFARSQFDEVMKYVDMAIETERAEEKLAPPAGSE